MTVGKRTCNTCNATKPRTSFPSASTYKCRTCQRAENEGVIHLNGSAAWLSRPIDGSYWVLR